MSVRLAVFLAASADAFTAAPLPKALTHNNNQRLSELGLLQPVARQPPRLAEVSASFGKRRRSVCQLRGGTMSESGASGPGFQWTARLVVKVAALFLLSGLAEIGGG